MNPSDPVSAMPIDRPAQVASRAAHAVGGSCRTSRNACSLVMFLCMFAALTGCSTNFGKLVNKPDSPFLDLENIKSPLAPGSIALLSGADSKLKTRQKLLMSGQGEKELEAAIAQYESGKRSEAVKRYSSIAKQYKETTTGEEAQYRYATAMYDANLFVKATDGYTQLVTDYPTTRYMDDTTKRLFKISRYWLDESGYKPSSEILQASAEEEQPPEPKRPKGIPALKVVPNVFDKTRPTFDTPGRALAVLRTIWLSDPSGDLADDALIVTANHYLQTRNFVEADRYFQILRDEYPRSPHLEEAFALGSHVKLLSYQGSLYDGTPLNEAEQLKERYLRLFPDSDNRQKLQGDLNAISNANAARVWEDVQYHRKKNNPAGIAIYCQQIIENHGHSKYAPKARQLLKTLDPKDIAHLPLNIPPEHPRPTDDRP